MLTNPASNFCDLQETNNEQDFTSHCGGYRASHLSNLKGVKIDFWPGSIVRFPQENLQNSIPSRHASGLLYAQQKPLLTSRLLGKAKTVCLLRPTRKSGLDICCKAKRIGQTSHLLTSSGVRG